MSISEKQHGENETNRNYGPFINSVTRNVALFLIGIYHFPIVTLVFPLTNVDWEQTVRSQERRFVHISGLSCLEGLPQSSHSDSFLDALMPQTQSTCMLKNAKTPERPTAIVCLRKQLLRNCQACSNNKLHLVVVPISRCQEVYAVCRTTRVRPEGEHENYLNFSSFRRLLVNFGNFSISSQRNRMFSAKAVVCFALCTHHINSFGNGPYVCQNLWNWVQKTTVCLLLKSRKSKMQTISFYFRLNMHTTFSEDCQKLGLIRPRWPSPGLESRKWYKICCFRSFWLYS